MDGAIVETGGMVAAGALVTPNKRVAAGELWGGSPAKLIRPLSDQEKETLTDGATHYAGLAQVYIGELS